MDKTIKNVIIYTAPIYTGGFGEPKWAIEVDYFHGNPDLFEFDTQVEQIQKAKELNV